jgi:hypothetical protein
MRSNGPFDLIGTEASGTSIHVARSTVDNGLDPLYIGLPSTVGTSVRVGNLDTESNALATIITLCHTLHLLSAKTHFGDDLRSRPSMITEISEKSKYFLEKILTFSKKY